MPEDQEDRSQRAHAPLTPPAGVSPHDYDLIEDAVMETARGRWFLKEYARRVRAAETASLLGALQRIEALVAARGPAAAAMPAGGAEDARERIASASEKLLDVVWYMRERGFESSICEAVDTEARGLGELAGQMGYGAQDFDAGDETGPGRETIRARLYEPRRPAEISLEAREIQRAGDVALDQSGTEGTQAPVVHQPVMVEPSSAEPCMAENVCVEAPQALADADALSPMASRLAALAHIDALPLPRKLALFA